MGRQGTWRRQCSCGLIDEGETVVATESSMQKLKASDPATAIGFDVAELHGSYGYCRDFSVKRLMRDAKICHIWEGTNQVHRQLIERGFVEL